MKNLFLILLLTFNYLISSSQDSDSLDSIKISIDWGSEINKNHKYKSIFKNKSSDYIKWIYKIGKNVTGYTSDPSNDAKYYHDGKGNNPIEFTITESNRTWTEVYKNAVQPASKLRSMFSISIPKYRMPRIEGSLPKGIITYLSDGNKGFETGIEIDIYSRKVKIEILDLNKKLVHIIEDGILEQGWHNYKWDTSKIASGEYILKHTVDGSEMSQIFELESRASIISRFFDWLF